MRFADLDRFDARSIRAFERVFGAAVIVNVATEIRAGVWRVHTGELYPWRHLPFVPLYPTWALAIEWAFAALGGALLVAGRPLGARLAAIALFAGLTQRYSNHAALLFLVAFYASLEREHREISPPLGLVRAQLLLVYLFGALNKITHGFLGGRALENLLGLPRAASIAVVVAEIALPFVLLLRPRVGIAGVVLLHLAFSLFMPGLLSFGLAMVAMALLFSSFRRT